MNMMSPASLANLKGLQPSKAVLTKLKAWRKAQMVLDDDGVTRRAMRITDAPRLYGIPWQTWHAWEQPVGHKDFKRPNEANMARLCGEITKGAVAPADFYLPMLLPEQASGDRGG